MGFSGATRDFLKALTNLGAVTFTNTFILKGDIPSYLLDIRDCCEGLLQVGKTVATAVQSPQLLQWYSMMSHRRGRRLIFQ